MKVKKIVNQESINKAKSFLVEVKNTLGEKGQALAALLENVIDEAEQEEAEVSDEDFVNAIQGILDDYKAQLAEMSEEVANLKNELKTLKKMNTIEQTNGKAVKNAICKAIFASRNKADLKNQLAKVEINNDVTGLSFNDLTDYAIVDGWGDSTGIYDLFYKTPISKFFYTADDLTTAGVLAKQWDKTSAVAKSIQEITANGKTLTPDYIYKVFQLANVDRDAIAAEGQEANFINYVTKELRRQWANSVVKAILVGDTTNPVGSRILTFESIGTKAATDAFTTVNNPATAGAPTFGEVFEIVAATRDDYGYGKVLFIDRNVLTDISGFLYASGGDKDYRGIDEMAAKLGVKTIIPYDLHAYTSDDVHAICIVPQSYWVCERKEIEVAYPDWDFNVQKWLFERNAGGGIHDLLSTAVLKEA